MLLILNNVKLNYDLKAYIRLLSLEETKSWILLLGDTCENTMWFHNYLTKFVKH